MKVQIYKYKNNKKKSCDICQISVIRSPASSVFHKYHEILIRICMFYPVLCVSRKIFDDVLEIDSLIEKIMVGLLSSMNLLKQDAFYIIIVKLKENNYLLQYALLEAYIRPLTKSDLWPICDIGAGVGEHQGAGGCWPVCSLHGVWGAQRALCQLAGRGKGEWRGTTHLHQESPCSQVVPILIGKYTIGQCSCLVHSNKVAFSNINTCLLLRQNMPPEIQPKAS